MHGNTSINPFFYGTYLAETKPNEPVTRSKKQAFQADAVGAIYQLSENHFKYPHTFRIEWQPGPGGRLDWFIRRHPTGWTNATIPKYGEWLHAFGIKDSSLGGLTGAHIPLEPTYLILNTAVSSTWGFPYNPPSWCPNCYDCNDPKCACRFSPGFCSMVEKGDVAMYVDSIRVYQSSNDDAHSGLPHTLGCDPPEYPTTEWIEGHAYRYSRSPPFSYQDKGPLKKVQKGGGACDMDVDCGSDVHQTNLTAVYETLRSSASLERALEQANVTVEGRGQCVAHLHNGMFSAHRSTGSVCSCKDGFTGPYCLAYDFKEKYPSAHEIRTLVSPFRRIASFEAPTFMVAMAVTLVALLLTFLVQQVQSNKRRLLRATEIVQQSYPPLKENSDVSVITGTSI
jgi:hypothetical protein